MAVDTPFVHRGFFLLLLLFHVQHRRFLLITWGGVMADTGCGGIKKNMEHCKESVLAKGVRSYCLH